MYQHIKWPDGKDFAFTVFDDTDFASLANVGPVYSLLSDLGFRTTKSVWAFRSNKVIDGQSLEDPDYLSWILELRDAGFEMGWHNAAANSSPREKTIEAIKIFHDVIGYAPKVGANHKGLRENIYWGPYRVSGLKRLIYNASTKFKHSGTFRGHIEDDPFFWGDVCKSNLKYYRNFVYSEINTLKACPIMPYSDPQRPYVNYWYASSEGGTVKSFTTTISEANQDKLEQEGGACIMYTHFAKGFTEGGRLNPRFEALMKRLSAKNGWFVPVSTLLDYLLQQKGHHVITATERQQLENRWLLTKIRLGAT
jgi:hypothetical protein